MELEQVHENLCNRDKRNPIWSDLYGHYEADDETPPEPRNDCYCDECFYGRDRLALEILRLKKLAGEPT